MMRHVKYPTQPYSSAYTDKSQELDKNNQELDFPMAVLKYHSRQIVH